jgi:uncharacterized repeat protein (TIGR03803 family)
MLFGTCAQDSDFSMGGFMRDSFSVKGLGRLAITVIANSALLLAAVLSAHGQTESVLWSFTNTPDGANPRYVAPVLDAKLNLYGTTNYGGVNGFGTVFELTSSGTEKILHSFNADGTDGFYPQAGLVLDAKGNLYGTTVEGGVFVTDGAVFKLTPTKKGWTEKILHSFGAVGDGIQPYSVVTLDTAGNLYGTTFYGGTYNGGTVFEVTSSGTEKVLWSFGNGTDGSNPIAGVIRDTKGTLYGTTEYGGTEGHGAVFELTSSGTEKLLWSFENGTDGANPVGGVVLGKMATLYGTTSSGGMYGSGTVFKVTLSGSEMVIHSFANNDMDGVTPYAGLVMDKLGNLYGTTVAGGGTGGVSGIVFEMTPSGAETILHNFGATGDGAFPWGGLVFDKSGNLYGTTLDGGANGFGTVFKVTP